MENEREKSAEKEVRIKRDILWQNVLVFIYLHMSAVYGLFLIFSQAQFSTVAFTFFLITWSVLSVTLGCHRLWAHQSYQANFFVRLWFIIGHSLACQGSVYNWILEHRIHHKYHETEMDPYNPKRGFLYSQITCRILSKHPDFEKIKRDIDMTDVEADSLVMWQKTLYWFIMPFLGIFLPINIPVDYLGEELLVSIFIAGFFRLAVTLHYAWLINNATLVWGLDPLDRRSADTNLIFIVNKSLWPHYHYVIPWDYQLGEYGNYNDGFCNAVLRVLAALGWAHHLRTVDTHGIRKALYESAKLNKPIQECIEQYEIKPTFHDIVSERDKPQRH